MNGFNLGKFCFKLNFQEIIGEVIVFLSDSLDKVQSVIE